VRKWLPRRIARTLLPSQVIEAPKRPVQTPQREWLRGELREWASAQIDAAIAGWGGPWLDAAATRAAWTIYCDGASDNSFYVWQWIGLGLLSHDRASRQPSHDFITSAAPHVGRGDRAGR
jgi:asparagine synthase (glutamine-hydrolysing)